MTLKTQEFDNSLNDFIDRVRSEFSRQWRSVDGSGEYGWAADVFDDHVIARIGEKYFRVAMEVTAEKITFVPRAEWQEVRLSYVAEMLPLGPVRDVMIVSEFKGKPPIVPFAAGVDVDELTDGDDKPVFVTLPIGLVNAKSGNKRLYDDKFVKELEKQVIANKPVGLMGHLKLEDRATEFPTEAVHWVGAARVGELLFGKGYVPPGEPRERLKRYKATKTKIATSIDCIAEGVWDEKEQAYRMKADTLRLGQIDIAPADRAGIADLAAVPHLTTEMMDSGTWDDFQEDNEMADKAQVIRELTADDAKILPEPVKQAVLAGAQVAPEVAQMQAVRELLGLDDKADVVQTVTEMRRTQMEQVKTAIQHRINELAADPQTGVKLEAVRGLVVELVTARNPQTIQEAEAAYTQVIESDAVKAALKSHVQETMGPRQGAGTLPGQNGKQGRYFSIPEEQAA